MSYAFVDALASIGSLATLIYGAVKTDVYGHKVWGISLAFFLLHPALFEILLNIKACFMKSSLDKRKIDQLGKKFPIVYSPGYNITACGLERMHPFDSTKYRRVFDALRKKKVIDASTVIH